MTVISFESVSKRYKLYSKGGLYLRDRLTHALHRFNPFNHRSLLQSAKSEGQSAALSSLPSAVSSLPSAPSPLPPLERDFWALKNLSFTIEQGESVGIIGRNGAGKSTILKLLAKVTKATSGTVMTQGKIAALIEVGAGFHPELTGRENVYLNASILGLKKAQVDQCFDDIVRFAELEEFIDEPVKHYSSGMHIRLGFAIAAHTNPDIYLIDEVLSVGDAPFQQKCLDTLVARKAEGKTMVLVSHQLGEVGKFCERCIYLSHGEIQYDGATPLAIERYEADLQKQSRATESSAMEAQITDVRFCRRDGDQTSVFSTGDDLLMEIHYRAHRRIERPIIGVSIHSGWGEAIAGFDSQGSSVSMRPLEGNGAIFCRLEEIPLNPGPYWVSVALHEGSVESILDRHHLKYRFDVECPGGQEQGVIHLKRSWARDRDFGHLLKKKSG